MVWNIGDFCVAKSSTFDDLYNAKILELLPNNSDAKVSFIEYGDIEQVSLADLKPFGEFSINKAGDLVRGDLERSQNSSWPGGWKVGDACVAWWDGDTTWNKAKIINIFNPEEVLVFFTEHGNADFTSLKNLKMLEGAQDAQLDEKMKPDNKDTELAPKSAGDNIDGKTKMSSWCVGDLCVAKWIEDGVWYRSKIIAIEKDEVLVEFVEYGNQDYTTIGELKPKDALDGTGEDKAKDTDVEKDEADSWKTGDLCVAKSSQFDAFYNGLIVEMDNNTALIEFIEYAKKEEIRLDDLKPFGPSAVNKNGDLVVNPPNTKDQNGWKDGDLCVSPWEVDKNLYNAKILKIFNSDEVLVQFVDHGNADFTSIARLKPAGSSLENTQDLNNDGKDGKKDKEMLEMKKLEMSNASKNSASSKTRYHENKTASNKKKEEKAQAANLEKREAGKWTGESRRRPLTTAIEKPRPLFKSDKKVEPKTVEPPSSRGQIAGSEVKIPPKTKPSHTDPSPIISRKAKLCSSESPMKPAALLDSSNMTGGSLPDTSNMSLATRPDNSNVTLATRPDSSASQSATSKKATEALPDMSNLDMVASTNISNISNKSDAALRDISNLAAVAAFPDTSNMAAVALTTSGSRYLQSIIPQMTTHEMNNLQVELMKNPLGAMNHPTATFVVQKLMEMCEPSSLEMYVSIVEEHFLALSVHPAGCRVVQKCLALANHEQKTRIGLMLENYRTLLRLLRNKNGTYVAQALLPTLPVRTTTFIVNALLGHMVDIGRNPYGTYFIQKLVTGKVKGQVSVQLLIEEIIKNVGYLAHDEFGTRLVQEVLGSSPSPPVISGVSQWVATNMTAVFKSSPAVFLAKAVIQKLAALGHGQLSLELLEDLVTSSLDTHVDSQPLLIAASLHPVGHGLAKEIVALVNVVPSRSKLLNTMQKFALILKQDTYGRLVLKALEGLI